MSTFLTTPRRRCAICEIFGYLARCIGLIRWWQRPNLLQNFWDVHISRRTAWFTSRLLLSSLTNPSRSQDLKGDRCAIIRMGLEPDHPGSCSTYPFIWCNQDIHNEQRRRQQWALHPPRLCEGHVHMHAQISKLLYEHDTIGKRLLQVCLAFHVLGTLVEDLHLPIHAVIRFSWSHFC